MRFLTGVSGFIGSHFHRSLAYGAVWSSDIGLAEHWDWWEKATPWEEIDLIIHQGAISSTTETDPRRLFKYNVESSIRLFEKAIEYQIPVKYASSASTYGNAPGIPSPLNQYALSKLQVDYWVRENMDRFSLIQGFRYFNVYGPGEGTKGDQASPISKFIDQAETTQRIKVFEGSQKFYRDFVWVGDIVDLVLNNDKPSGIYDLGTSNPISFLDVAEMVAEKYSAKIEIIPFPEHLKKGYQTYTSAMDIWDHKFKTVKEYLDDSSVH